MLIDDEEDRVSLADLLKNAMAAQIPPPPLFRRSVTLPTRFQEAATKGSPDNGSKTPEPETLFECSNVRIVSFAASLSRPSSSAGGVKQEAAGTLPWSKPTERVAAAGMTFGTIRPNGSNG